MMLSSDVSSSDSNPVKVPVTVPPAHKRYTAGSVHCDYSLCLQHLGYSGECMQGGSEQEHTVASAPLFVVCTERFSDTKSAGA